MLKTILGVLTICIALGSYVPYFRDVLRGKTKPHAFSWFIWGVLTAIAFFAQLAAHGGAGTWVTGVTALLSFAITGMALKVGRQNIVPIDWVFFVGALLAIGLWVLTKNPVTSVVMVTLIDAAAFVPNLPEVLP